MAKAAAMLTIQRHISAVKTPGKASVLENFLRANGNFLLFWRNITQNCCDLWLCHISSKHTEKMLPSKMWSFVKSKCFLRARSLEIYPHRSNMPLLLLAASLNVDFKLCKGSVLPFAKEILSFLSYIKRFDNIRGTVKHIPNILMTQELDAKYNSSSTSHTSVKLSLPLLRLAALSRRYQNLLHTVSILFYPLYLNCEPCGRYNSSSQTPPALKSYTMNIRKL